MRPKTKNFKEIREKYLDWSRFVHGKVRVEFQGVDIFESDKS